MPAPEGFVHVGSAAEVPVGSGLAVEVAGRRIAVFRVGEGLLESFHAIDDRCPHQGSPLSAGSCVDGVVTCPWHGWRFRVTDGAWTAAPANRNACYDVHAEAGELYVNPVPRDSR